MYELVLFVRGHWMADCMCFGRSSDNDGALVVCLLLPLYGDEHVV